MDRGRSDTMKFGASELRSRRRGAIVAGGDGNRLLPATRRIAGDDRPKQFCSFLGPFCSESAYGVSRFWEEPHGTLPAELMEKRLFVERRCRHGPHSRFPQSHPANALFGRSLRIQLAMVVYGLREKGIERALLQHRRYQLFSGGIIGASKQPRRASC